ncbi:ribosome-associated translation inhibitor RaiA [Sphingomonas sp.]|uniref:ribosome hibernation-promoting factor, HPF/YfiA family n=1 Tax=Sphingomonas sp. TaxID=28214 RepID=UPI0025FAFD48|nr:ribosome-associated translation inhibitor RaiA [Sphingomonas sp.]MBV9527545.1 ribosome-associated translation inhibitor RaiA [Sphingomonas sp.]
MDVRVSGHQVDTSESLRDHAATRMADISEKYFARGIGANVTFGRGPNNDYTCDILAPVGRGIVLKATYDGREPQIAFNGAADRIEKQLRRYTKRLREHNNGSGDDTVPYVENAGYTVFSGPADGGDQDEAPAPTIVAETRVDIPESSVSDAVMLMDLRNTGALMFRNSATGAFNMIYRREDGNIGWVEPQGE